MRGRKPKPTALRLIQGNAGHRSNEGVEITAPAALPEAPDYVTGRALAEWNRLGPLLRDSNLLSNLDANAFGSLCLAVAQLAAAQEHLALHGQTYTTPTGFERQSPHVGMRDRAMKLVAMLSSEFGLTPAARVRVKIEMKADEDEFDRYLARRSGHETEPASRLGPIVSPSAAHRIREQIAAAS